MTYRVLEIWPESEAEIMATDDLEAAVKYAYKLSLDPERVAYWSPMYCRYEVETPDGRMDKTKQRDYLKSLEAE